MSGYWSLVAVLVVTALWATSAAPTGAEPVRVNDLKDNVEVRLVAAKRSEGRSQHFVAKFETRNEPRKEIVIAFPAHSFTTHEQTLMGVIEGCIDRRAPDAAGWRKVRDGVEAVFSIPKDGIADQYQRCYLVSLNLGD